MGARRSPSLTERMLGFALGHASGDVPAGLLDWTALRFTDTVGVALACAGRGLGAPAARLVLAEPAPGPASVWGSGGRLVRADDACFANGMLAHGMDYDDTHTATMIHPSVVIAPTALALGEQTGASGRDVLAAGAVGYELAARLGSLAPGKPLQQRGFHPTSVLGIVPAAAVAARLLGLTPAEAVSAAGLAGSMASGLMEFFSDGTDAKQMHPGWAARGAVTAAKLARHGATGPATVLEGPSGLLRAFAGVEVDEERAAAAFDGLGDAWTGTGVSAKPYPAGHCVHACVDAWRALRDRLGPRAEDVRRITALVPSAYLHLVCEPRADKLTPRTVYDARFSLPFALALTVVDGSLGLDSFRAERLSDPAVLDVARRVGYEVVEYAEYPAAFPGGVRVELADGTVHEEHLRHNVGSPGNPMSAEDVAAKFRDCVRGLAGAEPLLDALRGLAAAPSLAGFTAAMAAVDAGLVPTAASPGSAR
ncbi:MmgE/PrpD family protein [Actinomadura chibensis]|uniref:MmgE/PrpD family protein n=1 Tax=Actinomadura chibensis TaxID=392828 RepID=A0A5D0NDH3_9ACTN|nr:MmgE/PrpD family protein [Actinomadura chibensis]TYB42447.1 MmgE/PrpD family protein [Actinomadura chibensis]